MSVREHNKRLKELVEAEMRKMVKDEIDGFGVYGKSVKEHSKGMSKGATKELASSVRALAKVLPQEAREVARDLREDAMTMNGRHRMERQAPKAKAAPKQVAVPDRSPVVARAAVAHPLPVPFKEKHKVTIPKAAVAAAAAEEEFVEPDLATLLASGMAGGAKAAEPGAKMLEKIHDMVDKAIARAKAGEAESSIFAYVDNVIGPEVDLYGAEYGSAGEAQELFESIGAKVIEAVRAAKPKAAGGAGGATAETAPEKIKRLISEMKAEHKRVIGMLKDTIDHTILYREHNKNIPRLGDQLFRAGYGAHKAREFELKLLSDLDVQREKQILKNTGGKGAAPVDIDLIRRHMKAAGVRE